MSCPHSNASSKDAVKASRHYSSYLQLNKLLTSQCTVSQNAPDRDKPVHDEHLFIVVHQVFELWFKQILVEIFSVRHILLETVVDESSMLVITTRLNRVVKIMNLFLEQFAILETMTPMDFMDFRDMLAPASGFQSLQFRIVENLLGVKKENRVCLEPHYTEVFGGDAEKILCESEEGPSLLTAVEKWLERTPGLDNDGFNFPERYAQAVKSMLAAESKDESESPEVRDTKQKAAERDRQLFDSILSAEKHQAIVDQGDRRLSHRATLGALLIFLYRDEPRFNEPFKVLQLMMDIDSALMKWRHNHVAMVQRFLGTRVGTGGSSGYLYLRSTVSERYKIVPDLFNLSSFILPRAYTPALTEEMFALLTRHKATSQSATVREQPGYGDASMGQTTERLMKSKDINLYEPWKCPAKDT
ncbi:tryptophan 2,3-dioxygenase-like [Sycon ciliatum]|uniref:tryptophan 2,3-dioxygenase-like n=1 Tax=Sycon ciliatum TaxID=27933 RepID=UPI0020ADF162|eukprot:scpid59232/ scgid9840/ Tryptophan 2,3-dioxygenase; Protein vermilion; Tryptamin 2,3-dioxygenase; Tryptophan oxygenase; Tryptophan pyrrolase; Tryptophanase